MARILGIYLLVTGGLTLVVLAFPQIIILGLLLLVLPGVLLASAPTAFAYGATFSLIWVPASRGLGARGALFLALAGTVAIALTFSYQLDRHQIDALAKARAGDSLPTAPIRLAGTVRIERDGSRALLPAQGGEAHAYACDDLCAAALFTPGVETVVLADAADRGRTMDDLPEGQDHTAVYRLLPGTSCSHPLRPTYSGFNLGLTDWRDENALHQSWRVALATGTCLERVPFKPG